MKIKFFKGLKTSFSILLGVFALLVRINKFLLVNGGLEARFTRAIDALRGPKSMVKLILTLSCGFRAPALRKTRSGIGLAPGGALCFELGGLFQSRDLSFQEQVLLLQHQYLVFQEAALLLPMMNLVAQLGFSQDLVAIIACKMLRVGKRTGGFLDLFGCLFLTGAKHLLVGTVCGTV